MEILNTVWVWILSVLGGLSLSTIFVFVIRLTIGSAVKKMFSKINVEKIADKATEKGVERVKKISFTHNIQPLVESELEKINEKSVEFLEKELKSVQVKYDNLINIIEKLACYFDNSIGVADEKKAELKQAIAEAKNEHLIAESVVVDEIVEQPLESAVETQKTAKSSTKVER